MPYVGKQILTITVLTRSRRWTGVHGPPLVRGLGVGVGQLMRTAVEKANPVRADIKLDG